ncbi:hypothetical protein [Spirillospora sp. NPDC047279]|uniref:hypothetical protein n=1 Tax=Spirillospora sp. NPDC047279 TaxID=3155478 RepID=UPI00340617B5
MPESSEENLPEGSSGSEDVTSSGERSDRAAWWGAFGLLALAFGFAASQIARGTEATSQVAVFAVAITMVTALLQTSLPLHRTALAAFAAFFATFLPIFGIQAVLDYRQSRRAINVLGGVELDKSAQAMVVGSTTGLTVRLREPRRRLKLQLRLEDHNAATSSCGVARQSSLRVRLIQSGNILVVQQAVADGQKFQIDLGQRRREARLDVRLANEDDPRCVMDLSVPFAEAK